MSKITSPNISIINVYRSEKAGDEFLTALHNLISYDKTLIICGDFNYCAKEQANHPVHKLLKRLNFIQQVQESTHREGRILDHLYLYLKEPLTFTDIECKVRGCYYSDHDKVVALISNV